MNINTFTWALFLANYPDVEKLSCHVHCQIRVTGTSHCTESRPWVWIISRCPPVISSLHNLPLNPSPLNPPYTAQLQASSFPNIVWHFICYWSGGYKKKGPEMRNRSAPRGPFAGLRVRVRGQELSDRAQCDGSGEQGQIWSRSKPSSRYSPTHFYHRADGTIYADRQNVCLKQY